MVILPENSPVIMLSMKTRVGPRMLGMAVLVKFVTGQGTVAFCELGGRFFRLGANTARNRNRHLSRWRPKHGIEKFTE